MKKNLLYALTLVLSVSCNDIIEVTAPEGPEHAYAKREGLKFMAYPLEVNKLEITFRNDTLQFGKLILKDDSETLAVADITALSSNSYSGALTFPFDPDRSYSIFVESAAKDDTVYRYQLPAYQHSYVSEFEFNLIKEFKRLAEIDFSPSENKMFIGDIQIEVRDGIEQSYFPLYELDLNSRALTLLDLELPTRMFRAISDGEVLTRSYILDGQRIGDDSVALVKTNIATKSTEVLSYSSSSSGKISRVVDGHVMYNAPLPNRHEHYLLNVEDGTITPMGFMWLSVNSHHYKKIIVEPGHVLDVSSKTFKESSTLVQEGYYLLFEDDNGYQFYIQHHDVYSPDWTKMGQSFKVEKEGKIVYQQPNEAGRFYLTRQIFNVANGKFVVYKRHIDSEVYRINGYYEIDIDTGTERLIKNEKISMPFKEFDLGDKGVVSVRGNKLGFLE